MSWGHSESCPDDQTCRLWSCSFETDFVVSTLTPSYTPLIPFSCQFGVGTFTGCFHRQVTSVLWKSRSLQSWSWKNMKKPQVESVHPEPQVFAFPNFTETRSAHMVALWMCQYDTSNSDVKYWKWSTWGLSSVQKVWCCLPVTFWRLQFSWIWQLQFWASSKASTILQEQGSFTDVILVSLKTALIDKHLINTW